MNIILVDDEKFALYDLEDVLKQVYKEAKIDCFNTAEEALFFAKDHPVDVAFLDVEMGDSNGIVVAKTLKSFHPKVNIIFVTGHSEYAYDALKLHSSGYLLKPVSVDEVKKEMNALRHPIDAAKNNGVYMQTFGNFQVFVNGKPVVFKRTKAKEILAYLVDRRGAFVSMGELNSLLWENKPFDKSQKSYLRTLIAELINGLSVFNAENMIIKKRNAVAVDVSKFGCDYYDFLNYKSEAINAFFGEYMSDYSWAEFAIPHLDNIKGEQHSGS